MFKSNGTLINKSRVRLIERTKKKEWEPIETIRHKVTTMILAMQLN